MSHKLNVFVKNKLFIYTSFFITFFSFDTKAQFTAGNIAILTAASSSSNNTTVSVLELNPSINNTAPVSTVSIPGSGVDAIRVSGSATSTCYLSNSNDGSQLVFTGHYSPNTSANANTLLTRAVVSLSNTGTVSIATTYFGTSGNQTRGATSLNNNTWFIAEQGGIYSNLTTTGSPIGNFRNIKSFGGIVYVEQQSSTTTSIQINTLSAPTGGTITGLPGLTNNSNIQDFYLVSSGVNGSVYDILYTISSTSATSGTITKYSLVNGVWVSNGNYTTSFGGFGLLAKYSGGVGNATLFVTSGNGSTGGNSVIKLTDASGFNTAINISTANNIVLYTTASGTTLKGIAWAPVYVPPPAVSLTAAPATIGSFNTAANTVSYVDSFVVNAANLTGNVSIIAPNYFEISDNANTNFSNSLTLTPTSGSIISKQIYVRFHPLNFGTVSGSIQLSTSGIPSQNVAVSGTAPSPTITTSTNQIANSFSCYQGFISTLDSFSVSGSLLGGDLTVTAPNFFQVSNSPLGGFSNTILLSPVSGNIANTTIYIRYSSNAYNVSSDTIKLTAFGATMKYVKVAGFTINSSNPVAYNLSNGIFNMNQWDSLSTPGTYPLNMIFHTSNVSTPILAYNQFANNWNCVYNLVNRSRIKGLSADGFSFINTGNPQYDNCASGTTFNNNYAGAALLALNTLNSHNITMSFKMGLVKQGDGVIPRVYNLRLQYRLDTTQNYVDYNPLTEYTSAGKTDGDIQNYSFSLPANFENLPYVEFRWVYYVDVLAGGSGTRPELRVDDIQVNACNSYVTPIVNVTTNNTTICNGTQVTFNSNYLGGGQNPNFQWLLNGTPIAGATNYTYSTNALMNTDIVSLVMGTSEICYTAASDTSNVILMNVNPIINPSISIVAAQGTVCPGTNVNFYSNLTDGGNYVTYQWLMNGNPISGATNPTYLYQANTNNTTISLLINTNYVCSTVPMLTSNPSVVNLFSINSSLVPSGPTTICTVGGAVTLTGDAGSNYLWNTGDTSQSITVSTAGIYSLVYTNLQGCQAFSDSVLVKLKTMPSTIKIKTVGATTVCEPNTVLMTTDMTAGSTTGFAYQWKLNGNIIQGVTDSFLNANASGSYTLTVSGGGNCSKTSAPKTATVKPLPVANFTVGGATTFCVGGSVNLTAPTITGYTYSWFKDSLSNGTGNIKLVKLAGTYYVVAKLGGCNDTSNSITVNVNPLPIASISTNNPTTFCSGDSAILNAIPVGVGYMYNWINGNITVTNQTPNYSTKVSGTFKVMVTDSNACISKISATSVKTKVNPIPIVTISALGSTTISATGYVKLNAIPASGVTWQWFKDGLAIFGATNKQYTATSGGNYSVSATKLSCTGYSIPTLVTQLGVKENICMTNDYNDQFELIAYPNPVNDILTIHISGLENLNGKIEIMDMLGRAMINGVKNTTKNDMSLNLSQYPSGTYLIHFKNEDGKCGSIKINKQ